jgi:Neprosin
LYGQRCRLKEVPETQLLRSAPGPVDNEDGHVSKIRRGWLAAGLAVAVVGSVGVLSTLNAGAEETPTVPAAAASGAAAEPTPPPLLPWGDEPTELTVAKAGASSAAVAASGADVAPADTSGSLTPEAEYEPKGSHSRLGSVAEQVYDPAPPVPPGLRLEPAPGADVKYFYAAGQQSADNGGSYANLTISKPALAKSDYHTLAEIAVQSADGRQAVEIGWTVDRNANGDDDPHIFVYHWIDGKQTCYNGCGFAPYSDSVKPGDTLPADTSKRFGIQHSGGNWWLAYDTEWVGSFPDSQWGGRFTRGAQAQWFGEVAASSSRPCTEMGDGQFADQGAAAKVGSISYVDAAAAPRASVTATANAYYSVASLSDRTFRYGGPGAC